MARKKLEEGGAKKGLPLWLGTFGDLMSLLLTFFILLLSMATFDKEKVDKAIGSLQGALAILEHGKETEITTPTPVQATPIIRDTPVEDALNILASLITEYSEMTNISNGPGIGLDESEDGFILRIPSELLFETGSAEVKFEAGRLFLERVAMEAESYRETFTLRVVGNTDNVPFIAGGDNWDLSNRRALSVAEILLSRGVPSEIVQVGGDGEFNPIATNETPEGRAQNRRVDIHFSFIGATQGRDQKAKEIINKIQGNPQ